VANILDDAGEETPAEGDVKPPAEGADVTFAEFTLPEGFATDQAALSEFHAVAGALGLKQEGAQQLVDLYVKKATEIAAQPLRAWNDVKTAWQTEIKAIPEYAGSQLKAAKVDIVRALDAQPRGPALRQALELTGAINHPEVFRFMHAWSRSRNESPLVPASAPASAPKTPGERMYGKS
jgi:hypothetical protein